MTAQEYRTERRRVCIFCGSSSGSRPEYRGEAARAGRLFAEEGVGIVFGGGHIGLMGAVADAALAAGGEVIGVIPRCLVARELAHRGITRQITVETMHERKAQMESLSDGFIALAGGYGTLDEFFEALTWLQLGIHSKPCVLVNTLGYYDPLLKFLDRAIEDGFLKAESRALIHVCHDAQAAADLLFRLWGHPARLDLVSGCNL